MSNGFEQRSSSTTSLGSTGSTASAPGKRTLTDGDMPRTTRDLDGARHAPTPQVAERTLNVALKVIVYAQDGEVLTVWTSEGVWKGPLPQHFVGERKGGAWTWSDRHARSVRVNTNVDGAGGVPVERWATGHHGARVEIYAEPLDAVATQSNAKLNANAPGTGRDPTNNGGVSADEHGKAHNTAGGSHSPGGEHHADGEGAGADAELAEVEQLVAGSQRGDQLAQELEQELGIDYDQDDEQGTGGAGREGGDPAGRTGRDTSTSGTGPGGPRARAGGQAEGSETARGNEGTKSGDKDGFALGSENGRFDGEGRDGDQGVRGAGALFGGVIAVPTALQGALELALLINAGDVTGAAGALFAKGVGKAAGKRISIAAARAAVARESRIFAAQHIRTVARELGKRQAFIALAKAERDQVLRIAYWETQRRYFKAYMQAAKQEQRAVRAVLRKAKPSQVAALEARQAAADAGVEIATVEPVAGLLPKNHAYAGKEFPRELLPPAYRKQGLRFKETGYPDFEPYAVTLPNGKRSVRIEYTGTRPTDYTAANRQAGFDRTPRGFTWHHDEADLGVMYLVPEDLHDLVKHTGGVAEYKHRTGRLDYDR